MATMTRQIAARTNPIQVGVPREVFGDFEKMQRVTKDILGKLGCPGCHSGYSILYKQFEDFVVNPQLEVKEVALGELQARGF